MKYVKIYKMSFTTQEDWKKVEPSVMREIETEEGTKLIPLKGLKVREYGHIEKPVINKYDEEGILIPRPADEDGNPIIEYYEDFAVDVRFDGNPKLKGIDPTFLRAYIPNPLPEKFHYAISGETRENIVKPL